MPSIPQSLLWISLVVLWLFVLVPMLVGKRDAVRRTSDVALATRVLTSGASARLLRRARPAAGHHSDPDWRAGDDDAEDLDEDRPPATGSAMVAAAADEQVEADYLDVDVIDEDSGALPVGDGAEEPERADSTEPEPDDGVLGAEYRTDDAEDDDDDEVSGPPAPGANADTPGDTPGGEYEYVEDTSGLEVEEDPPTAKSGGTAAAGSRRRRYNLDTAAAVSARKYNFRKRVLMTMAAVLVLSAAAALTVAPSSWWLCSTAAGVTVLYLAYLRRQTRIEEQVRARRMRRMAASRYGVDGAADPEFDVVPSRLHRPGAAVLEIDDEDPAFEHLESVPFARENDWRGDLPRAAGQ